MLRTIKLYGTLAIDTGVDTIKLDVNHAPMMFRGLASAIPDFRKIASRYREIIVIGSKENGTATEVVPTRNLQKSFEDCSTIHVMPATEGDISAAVAALIAAGVGTVAAYAIVIVGAIALMYGISKLSQMMAPKPTTGKNDTSFIFTGPQNTANQGGAVPIIYGTCLVGSTIIASNYLTIDVPVGTVANTYVP
jgi:predicted phage tail protein